jgi:hypothetical protein
VTELIAPPVHPTIEVRVRGRDFLENSGEKNQGKSALRRSTPSETVTCAGGIFRGDGREQSAREGIDLRGIAETMESDETAPENYMENLLMNNPADLVANGPNIFWGEIAPCEHLVQIYHDDEAFIDSLEGFVAGGLTSGDGVIVIATAVHLAALEERLWKHELNLDVARATDAYIPLEAEQTLSQFMIRGWPDEERFEQLIMSLLARARGGERRVRAFGEMVAMMWGRGQEGATVRLEHLWHKFCTKEAFSLFCAYPRSGFTQNAEASIKEICAAHSKVVPH